MKLSRFVRKSDRPRGMTLIELVIVIALVGILVSTAVPSYKGYVMRAHRTEAIRLLLQAAMCQQHIHATAGSYDTTRCTPAAASSRYLIRYESSATQAQGFLATAIPQGAQQDDPCGSLSLDQNGARGISEAGMSANRCWSGR